MVFIFYYYNNYSNIPIIFMKMNIICTKSKIQISNYKNITRIIKIREIMIIYYQYEILKWVVTVRILFTQQSLNKSSLKKECRFQAQYCWLARICLRVNALNLYLLLVWL